MRLLKNNRQPSGNSQQFEFLPLPSRRGEARGEGSGSAGRKLTRTIGLGVATLVAFASASIAQAQDASTNKPPWTASAAAGLTLTRGNSHTTTATLNLDADRKTDVQEILLGADATYATAQQSGQSSAEETAEVVHGSAQYNRFAIQNFYYGIKLDGIHDGIADINYRFSVSPLAGYYLINRTNTSLAVEAGPSLVIQETGTSGHRDNSRFWTLRAGERFEHKFSATARVWQSFEIFPQVDKFDNYYFNAEIGAEAALVGHWKLRSFIDDTYYNIPAAGRLKNDTKIVAALAYTF